jgi:microcystin-dependent protein
LAGTLFSLGLSQRFDSQGNPLIDAPLYIYEANTSTPVDVYQDFGLSVLHPWPLRTDSAGMIPAFWVDDGNYRARLTDGAGAVVYFDIANMQAVGPSSGEGEGGGGGSVDQNAIFATGDMLWQPKTGTRSGWVRANARTIGSAASGATERANADTQALYEYLWNNFSNTLCPVTGGRGGSAASDFAANKAIGLPDMRGRGPVGLDDMGNSSASRLADGTPTSISYGGQEKPTIAIENLPAHTHGAGTYAAESAGAHTHTTYARFDNRYAAGSGTAVDRLQDGPNNDDGTTSSNGAHTHTISGSSGSTGSGTPINTMNPYMLGTFYIKL